MRVTGFVVLKTCIQTAQLRQPLSEGRCRAAPASSAGDIYDETFRRMKIRQDYAVSATVAPCYLIAVEGRLHLNENANEKAE